MIKNLKLLVLVFCAALIVSFVVVFLIVRKTNHKIDQPADTASSTPLPPLMNKPLPEANLVDRKGVKLADTSLRQGKVILVFVSPNCPPCDNEVAFLKPLVGQHPEINFLGVVSFGLSGAIPESLEKEFPFKLYLDTEPRLAGKLGLYRVPIKVFLENGIIRKSWKGATTNDAEKAAFAEWLKDPKYAS
jgi:thiol-disulfide isomerase/thioredoxin